MLQRKWQREEGFPNVLIRDDRKGEIFNDCKTNAQENLRHCTWKYVGFYTGKYAWNLAFDDNAEQNLLQIDDL